MIKKFGMSTAVVGISFFLFLGFSIYTVSGLYPYLKGDSNSATRSVMALFFPDTNEHQQLEQGIPLEATVGNEEEIHIPVIQEDKGIAQLELNNGLTSDSSSSVPSISSPSSSSQQSNGTADNPNNPRYNVLEKKVGNEGDNYNNIWVLNEQNTHTLDIADELSRRPAVHTKKNGTPQVLIFHTHTTESYAQDFSGYYYQDDDTRTTDKDKSVVAVGEVIAQKLRDAGIGVIHDTTYHDYPAYRGSYTRSEQTVAKILEENPTIEVVIDVHRNSITLSDNTKIKPTSVINGQKAAQITIMSGCAVEGGLPFENWEYNLRFALRLQQQTATLYPDLIMPLQFVSSRYNMHLSKASVLLEVGAEVNTLEEAMYSGDLFGDALVKVMEDLME